MSNAQWDRVEKLLGKSISRLASSRVGIVGLGSLGSFTSLFLAMSGVGKFTLVDPDILEDHNVVRHAADMRYVNLPKVEAVRDLIMERNPAAKIKLIQDDARNQISELRDCSLVVIAGLGSEIATSEFAIMLREIGRVAIFGGLYEKAIAGDIIFTNPAKGPCYHCIASKVRDFDEPEIEQKMDYGMEPDELQAQPGLVPHIIRVASVLSDWAIRHIVRKPKVLKPYPGNLAILSNESYTMGIDSAGKPVILAPSSSYWLDIKKDPGCLICGVGEESNVGLADLVQIKGD